MDSDHSIAVIGCRFNTVKFIERFLADGFDIDLVVTISPSLADPPESVSGYADVVPTCRRHGVEYYRADDYSLEADRAELEERTFDLGFCIGWQRLIPEWFLDCFERGVFGEHGSYKRLPKGRGRAPANWSLIHGGTEFHAHVFRYEPGADEGDILAVETFDITDHDDIRTIQMKERVVFNRVMAKHVPDILQGTADLTPQPDEEATQFPKRTPQDGLIDWNQSVREIHNFVRAVTEPYPGAFGYVNGHEVFIWEGQPFDSTLDYDEQPGTIVETFYNGEFAVKTASEPYLVRDYESNTGWTPERGNRFDDGTTHNA